jgi:hypothetical protein
VGELVIDQPQALRQIASLVPRHALSPMDMVERAVTAGAGIEVIERLMALHERHEANTARKAFDEAMAAAKAEIPVIFKNRTVSYGAGKTSYKHEDMGQIARTVDPILAQHGLSYRYRTKSEGGVVSVTCIVSHAKGHSEENTLTCGVDTSGSKNAIQAIGSACTYLQRYSLKAALGLAASDDDDGRAAGDKGGNGNGASAVITDEQVAEIGRYIAKTNSNIGLFCRAMGVAVIPDIPAARYSHAIAMLKAKEAKQAAEGAAS